MRSKLQRLALGAVTLLAALAVSGGLATGSSRPAEEGKLVSVIIGTSGDASGVRAQIEARGGEVDRAFLLIPALEARIPSGAIDDISSIAAVTTIVPNAPVQSASGDEETSSGSYVFDDAIRADDVIGSGYKGRGIGIAVIDTGVATPTGGDLSGRVVASVAFGSGATTDSFGHGTHVAGIAAGDGRNSENSRYRGIAPGANIISVKVGDGSQARVGDAVAGLEWVVANKATYNIRVVNISLTSNSVLSYRKDPLAAAAEQAWLSWLRPATAEPTPTRSTTPQRTIPS